MKHLADPSGEILCGRRLRRDFAFLRRLEREKVQAVFDQTTDPEVVAFAHGLAEHGTSELALEDLSAYKELVETYGHRAVAEEMLADQVVDLQTGESEYIASGRALTACGGDHILLVEGFHTWRTLVGVIAKLRFAKERGVG